MSLPKRALKAWRSVPEVKRGYVVAFFSSAAAAMAGFLLRDFLSRSTYILFAAPVAMAAWYAGRGPAIFATVLGIIAVDLVFLERVNFIVPADSRDLVAIGVYAFVGLVITQMTNLIRSARAEAQRTAAQLEDQALELELQTAELEEQMQEAQSIRDQLAKAHEALRVSSNAQLAEAQAIARLGSWEWDIENDTVTWSDELFRLYALEPGVKIDFQRYLSLLHPEERDVAGEMIQHSLRTGGAFSYDQRVVRADGAERIFHARGKVINDEQGKPVRMVGTGQDVTDSRLAEAALRSAAENAAKQASAEQAARHLDRVFRQAPVLIAVLRGPDHTFELVNEKGFEMIKVEDLIGRPMREALPVVAEQGFGALLDQVYDSGTPFIGREVFATLDPDGGKGGYFNFVFQPLTEGDDVYGVMVVASDVSDLVESRVAAEDAHRHALAASRAKSDFLARMSHELRTPLAAIIGYGELLADGITGPVTDGQKKQLNRIRSSANHLLSIIDEILTLARMEAGKETVDAREVHLGELLESVAAMAEPLAAAKGLKFSLDARQSDMVMRTDPIKVRQVLLNLISNAVKYTDTGGVSLSSSGRNGEVSFLVQDTGVGVAPDHIEKIFEPFWQVEQTTTRRAGGTGLGLAVTRQFVDLLGGTISVESTLGQGSVFRVTIPSPAEHKGEH